VSEVPYTPWSDNSVWAAHGVPSTLFMSWPDEYFHSQLLTVEVTEPAVFAHVGAMVAAAVYEVAGAGRTEADWLAHWIEARSIARLHRERLRAIWRPDPDGAGEWTRKRLEHLCRRDSRALASLAKLVAPDDLPYLNEKIARFQKQLLSVKDQLLAEE
jgi:hypothetical protein